jgi:ferredoxin
MNETTSIFNLLKKNGYRIFCPEEIDGETRIAELSNAPTAGELSKISVLSWKYFFMPPRETLYKYESGRLKRPIMKAEKKAFFGMSVYDCKAMELYDRVFARDEYYLARRKNSVIVGFAPVPLSRLKTIFFDAENILASSVFDIFIESTTVYARGAGEKMLKSAGLKYKVLPYAAHKPDKAVAKLQKAMETSRDSKMWDELGKICLACGKCTLACPTCYCFDIESKIGPECCAERCTGNCFYDDFTRIAGGHKFLNSPKDKIFFWYYHKFVRIPFGYGLPGCVDCGRCTAVCPVGIDIEKNMERLLREVKSKKKKLVHVSS